ncbi:MAG: ribonuclease HI [Deltaproteobacteria bacterium]|nr:ribonuclease HI [Deltaproteobacteria bacterium]
MPWRTMLLRGKSVFVRCDERGELRPEGGRVEIRYKPHDGRAYMAGVGNLEPSMDPTVLPDDHCGPAVRPDDSKKGKGGKSKSKGKKAKPAPSSFPVTPADGAIIAYCDGACSGNPGPAGLGAVIRHAGKELRLGEFLGKGTNNIAELTAILRVLQEAPEGPLTIYTDSSYAIGLLTKNWKPKKNKELVADLRAALDERPDTDFVYVPGHAGVELNEVADELAVAAVSQRADLDPEERSY